MPWEQSNVSEQLKVEPEWGWEGVCELVTRMSPEELSGILPHMEPCLAAAIMEKLIKPLSGHPKDPQRAAEPTTALVTQRNASWNTAPRRWAADVERLARIHGRYQGGLRQEYQYAEANEQLAEQYRRRRNALLSREGRGTVAYGIDARPVDGKPSQYVLKARHSSPRQHQHSQGSHGIMSRARNQHVAGDPIHAEFDGHGALARRYNSVQSEPRQACRRVGEESHAGKSRSKSYFCGM